MTANVLQQPSLPALPTHQQNDTGVTAALASRFHAHLPTALVSSHGFVSINTYTDPGRGVDGGREGSANQASEELAERAYRRLEHRTEDQVIAFL